MLCPSRVLALIDASRDKVAIGGANDESQLYISPTVLTNVTAEDAVMKEEIFGPVLPIVVVENMDRTADEAIKFVNERYAVLPPKGGRAALFLGDFL